MSDDRLSWVAGIIEGEGSFICKARGVVVSVTMTDLDVLLRLSEYCGGHVYKLGSKGNSKWKQCWKWQLCGTNAYNLTKTIMPYSVITKNTAG